MSSTLGSALHLKRRFLRSISIERDAKNGVGLDGYIPTPTALAAKERIVSGITTPALRAVSLTGSYGTGKSAFALYLADQLAPSPSGTQREGFLPIFITGGREAIIPALMRSLDAAVYGQVSLENQSLTAKQAVSRDFANR
jgi:hypothetical protein